MSALDDNAADEERLFNKFQREHTQKTDIQYDLNSIALQVFHLLVMPFGGAHESIER